MTVLSTVNRALKGATVQPWQVEVARSLARAMDEDPNAALAKELRLLMAELTGAGGGKAVVKDVSDDLAAKRAARRRAAGS